MQLVINEIQIMRAKKIIISLRNPALTREHIKKLYAATGKAVEGELKKLRKANGCTLQHVKIKKDRMGYTDDPVTVNIDVEFSYTEPGFSELTAILNNGKKTIDHSGTITLSGIQSDDDILIQGSSLGKTNVKINVAAKPQRLDFEPGHFDDFFTIL